MQGKQNTVDIKKEQGLHISWKESQDSGSAAYD